MDVVPAPEGNHKASLSAASHSAARERIRGKNDTYCGAAVGAAVS